VHIAISLTHVAKSAKNARMRYRSRVVGADSAVISSGISVKRRKNGMAQSSQKVYQSDKKVIEWRNRMGMVHEIYEMRILVGAEMTAHMPKLTDTPERMNWYKVTPFKSWTLRNKVCAIPTSAAPTAVDNTILLPGHTVNASHSPRERLRSYTPHPAQRLSAITPNPPTMSTALNRAQSERQDSSTRRVKLTAASGLSLACRH
jgi:hypothetical protein